VKQTRRRTRNSYCASGNPIFSRSFLPLHYRELRVCHRLPEAEARDGSSSCLIPSCTVSSRSIYTTSAAPRNFIEFAAERTAFHGQLWCPTLSSHSALYSAILNPLTYNSHPFFLRGGRSTHVVPFSLLLLKYTSRFLAFQANRISFSPSLLVSVVALTQLIAPLIPFISLSIWVNEMFGASSPSLNSFLQEIPYIILFDKTGGFHQRLLICYFALDQYQINFFFSVVHAMIYRSQ